MKERGILFSADMVRALLDNRKTQTRRIIKPIQPRGDGMWPAGRNPVPDCPYGQSGDRLWVRETHAVVGAVDPGWVLYRASGYEAECRRHGFDSAPPESTIKWTPSIFMPRWASRITLRITDVRVERLQEISEDDAAAEGWPGPDENNSIRSSYPIGWYAGLWDDINGAGSWDKNQWVWVVSFERVRA